MSDHRPPTTDHRPDSVPLFRFPTGHELWRVVSMDQLEDWREEAFPDGSSDLAVGFASGFYFEFRERDVETGVFALVRDGRLLRVLSLGRAVDDDLLRIRLHPALPGHPDEDPAIGLRTFRWLCRRSFREPLYETSSQILATTDDGPNPVFLVHDDTEIRTYLLAAMPWVLPLKAFLEWLESSPTIP